MRISTFPLGPLQTNCYVIDNGTEAVAIDPGGEPSLITTFLSTHKLTLTHILCTHLHFDHTYGIAALQQKTGAAVRASHADAYMLETELGRGGMWGMPEVPEYSFVSLPGGPLSLLGILCTVLETPGHTPGGLSFYIPDARAVFAGDTLFSRSVGRTDLPGGNADTLAASIRTQLFHLPEDTQVYPGHGEPTSIGDEKRNNPFVSDFAIEI